MGSSVCVQLFIIFINVLQIAMKKGQEQFAERLQSLEEDLAKSR